MHHRVPGRSRASVLRAALAALAWRLRLTERALVASLALLVAAAVAVVVAGLPGPGATTVDARTAAARHELPEPAARGQQGNGEQPAQRQDDQPADHPADSRPAADQPATDHPAADQPAADQQAASQPAADRQAADQPNPNCSLTVPAAPLSAAGLATPYRLIATDPDKGGCHETNPHQSAFVEAAIIDPATGQISIYHPLVVDAGSSPASPPMPVDLPADAVVGIWFGFNGDTLTLRGPGAGQCINGLPGSPFGQFAYCNAPAFFEAANAAIDGPRHLLAVPALGTAPGGLPCPTTRDFSVVDQDQSDNLATTYRVIHGRVAQTTPQTASQGTRLSNGSDEGLLATAIDPVLGCTPWTAPDLTNPGTESPALALNELSAARNQGAPVALTPLSDPMTQVDGGPSVRKTNLYRAGVDMPPLQPGETPQAYCANILAVAPARLSTWATQFRSAPSPTVTPDPQTLLQFLRARLQGTLEMLNCRTPHHADGQAGASDPAAPNSAGQDATPAVPAGAGQGTGPGGAGTPGSGSSGTPSPGSLPLHGGNDRTGTGGNP